MKSDLCSTPLLSSPVFLSLTPSAPATSNFPRIFQLPSLALILPVRFSPKIFPCWAPSHPSNRPRVDSLNPTPSLLPRDCLDLLLGPCHSVSLFMRSMQCMTAETLSVSSVQVLPVAPSSPCWIIQTRPTRQQINE